MMKGDCMSNNGTFAKAMVKVQKLIRSAVKDKENPFFKSSYADLTAVWGACREALTTNGFAVLQKTGFSDDGEFVLKTKLLHESGQFEEGEYLLKPAKPNDPQAMGSCLTYARRYSLASMVGVVTDDDDGEGAMDRNSKVKQTSTKNDKVKKKPQEKPKQESGLITSETKEKLRKVCEVTGFEDHHIVSWYRKEYKKPVANMTEVQAEGLLTLLKGVADDAYDLTFTDKGIPMFKKK